MEWLPMHTAPKDKAVLILLDESAGIYPALAQWRDECRGFVWHVPGGGIWHKKCALGWSPVDVPATPSDIMPPDHF